MRAAEAARDAARDALGQALGASPRAVDGLRVAIEVAELAGLEDSNEIELRRARSALTETQRDERDTELPQAEGLEEDNEEELDEAKPAAAATADDDGGGGGGGGGGGNSRLVPPAAPR